MMAMNNQKELTLLKILIFDKLFELDYFFYKPSPNTNFRV